MSRSNGKSVRRVEMTLGCVDWGTKLERIGAQQSLQAFFVTAAEFEFRSIMQYHEILAVEMRMKFLDVSDIYNHRTVYAGKPCGAKPLCKPVQCLFHMMDLRSYVHPNIIAISLHPRDMFPRKYNNSVLGFESDTLRWEICKRP